MNLRLALASSLSLISTLLVVAPAFADDPAAPAPGVIQAPVAAPPVSPPPAYTPPAYTGPGYSLPPGQPPMMVGPAMYAPYSLLPPILETHRASPALIITGAVTTFLGLGATVGGTLSYMIQTGVVCAGGGIDGSGSCGSSGASGIALMVGGSVAMLGGVTMIVLGARKVTTPLPEASLQLRPTGADLRLTF